MRAVAIWDAGGDPPAGDWTTVLWRSFDSVTVPDAVSMPRIVEERAHELRARFLSWIYDVGDTRVHGTRVVEHLALRPGLSYWWMHTLSHTPNYYEAPFITDAIKCLALEDVLAGAGAPSSIRLHTANAALRDVLEKFCGARGVPFSATMEAPDDAGPSPTGRSVTARVRSIANGLLRHLTRPRRPLPNTATPVSFFDVLVYLQPDALAQRRFHSHYWGGLTHLLERAGISSTWLHIFYAHAEVPAAAEADAALEMFERGAEERERHLLLDGYLSLGTIAKAVASYLRLARAARRLRGADLFTPAGSEFDFRPFFERNWQHSLTGAPALRHTLRLALYEHVLSRLPRQPLGIFLLENQPWEMALMHAWRASGHGRLVGVPHTTVRFWDLRYFYDPRTYAQQDAWTLPMPDTVAVNGPSARQAYVEGGYPEARLADVEALRFAHLTGVAPAPPGRRVTRNVLICGDNIPGSNEKVMRIVERAAALLPPETRFVFKPHRASAFDSLRYPGVRLDVRDGNLAAMIGESDIVVTGTVTSASADAYSRGRRVAVLLDGAALDGCPLRGLAGVARFSSAAELARIVQSEEGAPWPVQLFHLDAGLPRWHRLLTSGSSNTHER